MMLVKNLKKLIAGNQLALSRRICKRKDGAFILFRAFKGRSKHLAFHIADAKIDPCNFFKPLDIRL